jgi:hypothetical protein
MSNYGALPPPPLHIPVHILNIIIDYAGNPDLSVAEQIKARKQPVIHLNETGAIVISYYSHETYNNDGIFKHKIDTRPLIIDPASSEKKYFKVDTLGNKFYKINDLITRIRNIAEYPYSVDGASRIQRIPPVSEDPENGDPTNGGGYRRHTRSKKHKRIIRRRKTKRSRK